MSGEESRFIGDLPRGARQVVRALAALDLPTMSADELAAAMGIPETHVRAAVADLVDAGWLTTPWSGRYALAFRVAATGSDEFPDIRRRFSDYMLGGVCGVLRAQGIPLADLEAPEVRFADPEHALKWLVSHQESLVAAVRIGTQQAGTNPRPGSRSRSG